MKRWVGGAEIRSIVAGTTEYFNKTQKNSNSGAVKWKNCAFCDTSAIFRKSVVFDITMNVRYMEPSGN